MKKRAILGSTVSIGTQTLEIVRTNKDIEVTALAAGRNIDLLERQIREFRPKLAAVWSEDLAAELKTRTGDLQVEVLSGMEVRNAEDMEKAAAKLQKACGCAVLCKGGHRVNDANDLLCMDGGMRWLPGKRVDNSNTHGTGCTLSSAIASNLALGYSLEESVRRAKAYLTGALEAGLNLGKGSGPVNHIYGLRWEPAM